MKRFLQLSFLWLGLIPAAGHTDTDGPCTEQDWDYVVDTDLKAVLRELLKTGQTV